ncbi:hypothetical protein HOJ01_01290 [bacterium]|jgi:hypothetical protein|nr:hypothetical protein [bacterium]MBT6293424.1 hypothetical protein [bacterium]
MKFKDLFQDLFVLVLSVTVFFSSVNLAYNLISHELLELPPRNVDYYQCENSRYPDENTRILTPQEISECEEREFKQASERLETDVKYEYAWALSALLIGLPVLFYIKRKN